MKRKPTQTQDLRPEYQFDYSKGERGKYLGRVSARGSRLVELAPDVARAFPDSEAVNAALRVVLSASKSMRRGASRGKRT